MSTTCRDCAEHVTAYLDGVLPPAVRAEYENHFQRCPPCGEYVEQMKRTLAAASTLPCTGPCQEAKAALIAAVRAKCPGKPEGAH